MKRRGIIILFLSLIFVSLIGVVSGGYGPNIIPSVGKTITCSSTSNGNPITPTSGNSNNIVDENNDTYYGVENMNSGDKYIIECIVDFTSLENINKISVIDTSQCPSVNWDGGGNKNSIIIEVYQEGSWNRILGLADAFRFTQLEHIVEGNWDNVEKIKVQRNLDRQSGGMTLKIHEIRVFKDIVCGDGTCDADEDCSNCEADCGVCSSGGNSCSDDNQLIMRLYQPDNSQGALWNGSVDYTIEICYNDIFGDSGDGNHACSAETIPTNKILGLYQSTNAHAQKPSLDTYSVDVCYGNLACRYVANGDCDADENCVVTLFDEDNSHMAVCDSANAYPNKICCKLGGGFCGDGNLDAGELCETGDEISCSVLDSNYESGVAVCADCSLYNVSQCSPEIISNCGNNVREDGETCDGSDWWRNTCEEIPSDYGVFSGGNLSCNSATCQLDTSGCIALDNVYWTNTNGKPISEAQIGDIVLMIYEEEGITTAHTFDVWESDEGEIYLGDDEVKTGISSSLGTNKIIAEWKITQEDYSAGACVLGVCEIDNEAEFYFKVNETNSPILIVKEDSDEFPGANSPPKTKIIKPVKDTNYSMDETGTNLIDFIQKSSDEDDRLKIMWMFGDGENITFENCFNDLKEVMYCDSGNGDTNHMYTSSGTKTIKLTAQEMTRGQKVIDYSRVFVHKKGINVFAIIDKPGDGIVRDALIVRVDGRSSFAEECDDVSCLGSNCYTIVNGPISLQCYRKAKSNVLEFEWIFDGNIDTEHNDDTTFVHFFPDAGEHIVDLKVTYDDGL